MKKEIIYSVLLAIAAILYYMFHQWWLKIRKTKEQVLNDDFKQTGIIKDWIIIIMLLLGSLAFFLESLQ